MTKSGTITYATVDSRKIVKIVLMIASLNDFEFKLADILNSYIETHVTEKV